MGTSTGLHQAQSKLHPKGLIMRTLLTRDGRLIGNAIIIEQIGRTDEQVPIFLIETDFGNRCKLNQNEIEAWFYPGDETTYASWSTNRSDTQNRTFDNIE